MLSLYPDIEPFNHFHLNVSQDSLNAEKNKHDHYIYVEQCGNPSGIPVLFLHGGPGSGCKPSHRRYFDPKVYHIILFDQRGCGRSYPYGSLVDNTTAHLIKDIELIRQHLSINEWLIFGGSWGSTLGLNYAHYYPKNVSGLILRGVFLARQEDIDWVYTEKGAAKLFPNIWENLVQNLPVSKKAQPLNEIYQQLNSGDTNLVKDIFHKLQHWETSLINWKSYIEMPNDSSAEFDCVPMIIQLYYSINKCFLEKTPILRLLANIQHIPTTIIHGRFDMVCPIEQAWVLKRELPEANLSIIEMAGHVANEPAIIDALIKATNNFSKIHFK